MFALCIAIRVKCLLPRCAFVLIYLHALREKNTWLMTVPTAWHVPSDSTCRESVLQSICFTVAVKSSGSLTSCLVLLSFSWMWRLHTAQVEIIPMPYVTESAQVNIILPLTSEERSHFESFMDKYAKVNDGSGSIRYAQLACECRRKLKRQ